MIGATFWEESHISDDKDVRVHINIEKGSSLPHAFNPHLAPFLSITPKYCSCELWHDSWNEYNGVVVNDQHMHLAAGFQAVIFKWEDSSSSPVPPLWFLISLVRLTKVSSTFLPVLALTSRKSMLCFSANFLASSSSTSRSSFRSALVPMSILLTVSLALLSICLIQLPMFLKDCLLLTPQARMMPLAPLQQVCVMLRKRSCPAVSQIWRRILESSTVMVLILKSTPMVATQLSLKTPSQNLVSRLVFPTPLSPIMITFARRSFSDCFVAILLLLYAAITAFVLHRILLWKQTALDQMGQLSNNCFD